MKSSVEKIAELLPSLRAEIAKELIFAYKLNQKDTAKLLGVSQPAVSQYARQLRGKKNFSVAVKNEIKAICEKLINNHSVDLENDLFNLAKLSLA